MDITEDYPQDWIERVIAGAEAHGTESEPEMEIGDLQMAVRLCWQQLGQAGREAAVHQMVSFGVPGACEHPGRIADGVCQTCHEFAVCPHDGGTRGGVCDRCGALL